MIYWNSFGRGCSIDDRSAFVATNDPIDISVFSVKRKSHNLFAVKNLVGMIISPVLSI